ncbi:hypothetical protein [Rouxiella sp. Mn2063]|uniref:hypothetical protein n=1 Tax=Rouxiella sp. Mn2063 TaxID=3395262 RepID=UPI003BEB3FD9
MFKFVVICFLFFFASMNSSYAFFMSVVKQDANSYIIRGSLNKTDIVLETGVRPWPGVFIWYNSPEWDRAATYINFNVTCPRNIDLATQLINKELSFAVMLYKNFSNNKDKTIMITCAIDEGTRWKFNSYIGKPIAPNSPSCQVNAPLDINFGTVTIDDNNKVIEKQVTIKCDKETKVRLTLEGDNKTNLLTLSDTVIKLGVDGDTQTKDYDIEEGKVSTANLTFTLTDTGNTPGVKKGYVLLVSEIP